MILLFAKIPKKARNLDIITRTGQAERKVHPTTTEILSKCIPLVWLE